MGDAKRETIQIDFYSLKGRIIDSLNLAIKNVRSEASFFDREKTIIFREDCLKKLREALDYCTDVKELIGIIRGQTSKQYLIFKEMDVYLDEVFLQIQREVINDFGRGEHLDSFDGFSSMYAYKSHEIFADCVNIPCEESLSLTSALSCQRRTKERFNKPDQEALLLDFPHRPPPKEEIKLTPKVISSLLAIRNRRPGAVMELLPVRSAEGPLSQESAVSSGVSPS